MSINEKAMDAIEVSAQELSDEELESAAGGSGSKKFYYYCSSCNIYNTIRNSNPVPSIRCVKCQKTISLQRRYE